jgi:hypothetical protein
VINVTFHICSWNSFGVKKNLFLYSRDHSWNFLELVTVQNDYSTSIKILITSGCQVNIWILHYSGCQIVPFSNAIWKMD